MYTIRATDPNPKYRWTVYNPFGDTLYKSNTCPDKYGYVCN